MPPPFQDMLTKAAGLFESDLTSSSHAQLQRALGDRSPAPASRSSRTAIRSRAAPTARCRSPISAALFAPNGIFDKFFTADLAPLADTSKRDWTWRQDHPLARTLSPATLREFQRAAQIRDAFFPTGGNMPSLNISVTPPALASGGYDREARDQRRAGREQGQAARRRLPSSGRAPAAIAPAGRRVTGDDRSAQPSRPAVGAGAKRRLVAVPPARVRRRCSAATA